MTKFKIEDNSSYSTIEVNGTMLPHGSGINYDWHTRIDNDKLICSNCYHSMDENGMYCCVVPFSVTFDIVHDELTVIDITVDNNDCDLCYTDDLDDYLWQTFSLDFNI